MIGNMDAVRAVDAREKDMEADRGVFTTEILQRIELVARGAGLDRGKSIGGEGGTSAVRNRAVDGGEANGVGASVRLKPDLLHSRNMINRVDHGGG